MGRSPCCDKVGLKKGPWTPEEDQKLLAFIEEHGHGSWRALPLKAGLQRCGKSCRLRWTNYLRPDIKRGKFSLQEEQTIIQLHALLGNRWSAIATHLPKRTDNEIKNYWNTHLKKRLAKMGIDPVTHKPKNDALLSSDGQSKNAANLSHMAQWESARLEAEARLVRESKVRSLSFHHQLSSSDQFPPDPLLSKSAGPQLPPPHRSVAHILNKSGQLLNKAAGICCDLESPTSSLTFSENAPPIMTTSSYGEISTAVFVGSSGSSEGGLLKEEGEHDWKGIENSSNMLQYKEGIENSMSFTSDFQEMGHPMEGTLATALGTDSEHLDDDNAVDEGFTNLLLNDSDDRSLSDGGADSDSGGSNGADGHNDYEDSKNYWNSILDLVNSSASDSPMF